VRVYGQDRREILRIRMCQSKLLPINRAGLMNFLSFLKSRQVTKEAYAEIKYQLARYFPNNAEAYHDIKELAFDLFMVGAWD
jgi:hypothetical protein